MDTFFVILFLTVLAYEAVALFVTRKRADTISGKSWDLRDYLWGRMLVDTFLLWFLWHIVIDDTFFITGASWVDLVIVAIGLIWAWWSWHHEYERGRIPR